MKACSGGTSNLDPSLKTAPVYDIFITVHMPWSDVNAVAHSNGPAENYLRTLQIYEAL